MLSSCVFLLSLFCGFSPQGAASPIVGGQFVGKITNVNGKMIVQNENKYPYMVHLLLLTKGQADDDADQCGGVLIGAQTVLTAAHCILSIEGPPRIEVTAGALHLWLDHEKAQMRLMEKYLVHEEYVEKCDIGQRRFHFCRNDIALIWVAKPFKFGPSVRPAILASGSVVYNQVGMILGWGNNEKGTPSVMLRQAEQKVASLAVCKKEYGDTIFGNSKLCIISESKTSVFCYGDSGGPFSVNGVLHGIGSFGRNQKSSKKEDCDPKRPSVYTNVTYFENWIKSGIRKWSPKELKQFVRFEGQDNLFGIYWNKQNADIRTHLELPQENTNKNKHKQTAKYPIKITKAPNIKKPNRKKIK